ncbi:hypothetical protein Tco_0821220 [Tanacetum coccineum]|uniref:Retrovirus-related Pol polyprotein from transposon TNT 1-94-like beta-barrel domain-containing protein n=1 Tax=Tanacetum coccineum TaxID=301880 RepID=A0ABQ5ABM3_9ASTR
MANLSHYGLDALAEVHNHDNVNNNMINQAMQAMPSSEQSNVVNHSETKITSDSNIIPYSQYVIESQQAAVQNSNSSAQQDALILSVIEQLKTQVVNCTKINLDNKSVNDALTAELERYKEQVKVLKEGQNVDLRSNDTISDSSAQSIEIDHLKQTLSEHLKEKESLMKTVTLLKNDFKKEESRNIDREIALEKKIKQLDNIKAQQLEPKLYDGNVIKNTSAIVIPDSEETLMLAEESQPRLFYSRPTKVEVPKELFKVIMVNTSLKKLKYHLAGFDVVVKERTTPTAITGLAWGISEHTKLVLCFCECAHECEKCLKLETELLNKKDFIEKEIYDKLFKSFTTLEKHCLSLEVDTQLNQEIFQRDNSVSNQSHKEVEKRIKSLSGKLNEDKIKKDLEEIETINIELDHRMSKLIAKNEHLKQTYKQLYDSIKLACIRSKEQCDDLINQVNLKSAKIFDLNPSLQEKVLVITALKDDLKKLKGKAVVDNAVMKHTIDPEMLKIDEEATILRDLVEQVKSKYPLDHSLESASRYAKLIQELLTNISKTCPSINNIDEKLVAVNPKNKHSKLNTNSELKYVKCKGCMLSDNHDLCVLDFINNVNARVKSKSIKKSSKRKVWKPTGKVFTNIGYIWRPTGRTFTIVGNACLLTRITTTTEVPLRKPIVLDNEIPKPVVTLVYTRKPRKSKTNVPARKSKVVQIVLWYLDSGCSKHMTGDRSQLTNFVNKFLGTVKFGNDHVAKILGYGDYQIGNVTISRVYYVEGLGHNLLYVG